MRIWGKMKGIAVKSARIARTGLHLPANTAAGGIEVSGPSPATWYTAHRTHLTEAKA
jgi:hypothetical protein